MPRERLSPAEARRLAIAAQGLARPPAPASPRSSSDIVRVARRLRLVQIDSVNVLARAHLLTLHARLGAFDPVSLEDAAYGGRRRRLFEYWGHEASFIPVEDHRLWRWRMEDARAGTGMYLQLARFGRERVDAVRATLTEIERRGALSAGDLAPGARGRGGWWGWSETKCALEWLFWAGLVTTATRRGNFERVYDLPERCLPSAALEAPTPTRQDAQRALLLNASRAHGVATVHDLADYARVNIGEARERLAEMIENGDARPVRVQGWEGAVMDAAARNPRRVEGDALLCPFDPLIWTRPRTERLFGMRYRLEIYTPEARRTHGYYVLPYLCGDRLVARLDLKADRTASCLRVLAAHREPGWNDCRRVDAPAADPAGGLSRALRRMADWTGCADIEVGARGDLAGQLRTLVEAP